MSAIQVLKSWGIALDNNIVFDMPSGNLSDSCVIAIDKAIDEFNNAHVVQRPVSCRLSLPYFSELVESDQSWLEWLIASGDMSGTMPKRYSKWVKKHLAVNVPDTLLGRIGSECAASIAKCENRQYIRFTNNLNWCPGDFGESSGSCWWTDYNGARIGLMNNEGCAVQFFSDDSFRRGIGRAWLYADDCCPDTLFMFNSYMSGNQKTPYIMARIVSTMLGKVYARVSLNLRNAYLNGFGVCLASPDKLPDVGSTFCFDFFDPSVDGGLCDHCGEYRTGDMTRVANGNTVCEWCLSDYYYYCEECGDYYQEDDVVYVESQDNYICDDCINDRYFTCASCGSIYRDNESNDSVDGWICDECASNLYATCDGCGQLFGSDDLSEVGDGALWYCSDCMPEDEDENNNEVVNE